MSERIAIIGGGKIGEALLAGLIGAGTPTKDLVVAERGRLAVDAHLPLEHVPGE